MRIRRMLLLICPCCFRTLNFMNNARRTTLDFETIVDAFDVMGRYLRDELSQVGEIAVYGGTAILLQFPWRKMTEELRRTG